MRTGLPLSRPTPVAPRDHAPVRTGPPSRSDLITLAFRALAVRRVPARCDPPRPGLTRSTCRLHGSDAKKHRFYELAWRGGGSIAQRQSPCAANAHIWCANATFLCVRARGSRHRRREVRLSSHPYPPRRSQACYSAPAPSSVLLRPGALERVTPSCRAASVLLRPAAPRACYSGLPPSSVLLRPAALERVTPSRRAASSPFAPIPSR